ncbi:MAG TPA: hypothetical protein QF753_00325 [Victivallales bacterium]|nr:hypothetical protein [Victivallales bacterium]
MKRKQFTAIEIPIEYRRVNQWLSEKYDYYSSTQWQEQIKSDYVAINERIRPSRILTIGDVMELITNKT